ncbi:hypothetical protein Tdes44962_MAKER00482 [Teratosphaeria destructans]|uniref:Uncharacterized protein n=1 Tax=Teratosphaeria destructans TaxID=418781 RepID=A0A9W7SQ28_9PEZI|nr:hypothetical protein Tdes44962_MAKER00482 [Teratosphaeria destructans]
MLRRIWADGKGPVDEAYRTFVSRSGPADGRVVKQALIGALEDGKRRRVATPEKINRAFLAGDRRMLTYRQAVVHSS